MADSNSQQPRCPCGFWGSVQTQGLCSKCYKEHQKKSGDGVSSGAGAAGLTSGSMAKTFTPVTTTVVPDISEPTTSTTSPIKEETDDSPPTSTIDDKTEDSSDSSKNENDPVGNLDPNRPVQKNKKRCFKCNIKLELALREIGRCRCDYIFCQLHRLPEQHDCIFDHKESGRKAAREKMVSPKKHMGTSLRRLDSDS